MKVSLFKIEGKISSRALKYFDSITGFSSIQLSGAVIDELYRKNQEIDYNNLAFSNIVKFNKNNNSPLIPIGKIISKLIFRNVDIDEKALSKYQLDIKEIFNEMRNNGKIEIKLNEEKKEKSKRDMLHYTRKGRGKKNLFSTKKLSFNNDNDNYWGFLVYSENRELIKEIKTLFKDWFYFGADKTEGSSIRAYDITEIDIPDITEAHNGISLGDFIPVEGHNYIGRLNYYNSILGNKGYRFPYLNKDSICLNKCENIHGKNHFVKEAKKIFIGKTIFYPFLLSKLEEDSFVVIK